MTQRYLFIFLLLFVALANYAQENPVISKPLDIRERGFNKVLCMKNGNTLLFHVETTQSIMVKVFDSTGKNIATNDDGSRILDQFAFSDPILVGAYDIDSEAVLFIDQEIRTKHCLVRLQYSAKTGHLINEQLVAESMSANKRMQFFLMKDRDDDNYEIFFCTYVRHPVKLCDMYMVYFDKHHKSLREVQLPCNIKKWDYLKVLGAESQPNGVLVTIGLDKTVEYGRPDHEDRQDEVSGFFNETEPLGEGALMIDRRTPLVEGGATYDHFICAYYIPKGDTIPKTKMCDMTPFVYPFRTIYTYNKPSGALNCLLFNYAPYDYTFGMNKVKGAVQSTHLIKMDEHDLTPTFTRIKDSLANAFLRGRTDSSFSFIGAPVKYGTDDNGLSTVVSLSQNGNFEPDFTFINTNKYIGITRFDQNGTELWGTILPLQQFYNVKLPYYRQFLSVNTYMRNGACYIICNDYERNQHSDVRNPGDGVYDYTVTNTYCIKVDGANEVTKTPLYGPIAKRDYKSTFIQGADFDQARGRYAALVQYNRHGKTTLNMAWSYLN